MGLGLLLVTALAAIVSSADCYCLSTTLYATKSTKTHYVSASAYNYCQIKIQPSSYYSSSYYYLEITWPSWKFDVTGNMPFCQEAHMEVFLTSGYRSIGRFCSNNAGAPFTMYSRDGYAKIVVSVSFYGRRGAFSLNYKLKSKSSYPLGSSSSSSTCYNTNNYGSSGVIYSTGWPYSYKASSSSCNYKIMKSNSYQGIYVVFMDINLYSSYWYSYDCVQLRGSNYSSYYYGTAISSSLCGTVNPKSYNTYSKYLTIKFNRRNRPSYGSYRGFVAGYVMFGTTKTTTKPWQTTSSLTTKPANKPVYEANSSSFPVVAVVLGIVSPIIIIIIIVIAVVFCVKKRQRSSAWDADHADPQSSSTVSTAQHSTTQQTLQAAAPPAYTNLAFSQPQQFYPTTSMQTAMYPVGTHHVVYPTTQAYSTGQFTAAGNAPPQYSFVVAPTQSSIPVGALQPARASVSQAQQPTGVLSAAPSSSSNSGASAPLQSAPLPATSIQMSRNVPPPAYCDVAKS